MRSPCGCAPTRKSVKSILESGRDRPHAQSEPLDLESPPHGESRSRLLPLMMTINLKGEDDVDESDDRNPQEPEAHGMLQALEEQQQTPTIQALSFEEPSRLSSIAAALSRQSTKSRLLRGAHFKVAAACIEDINYKAARGLDKKRSTRSPPANGSADPKTCSSPARPGAEKRGSPARSPTCCRQGASVTYWRVPRLSRSLSRPRRRSYIKFLKSTAKASLLVLVTRG